MKQALQMKGLERAKTAGWKLGLIFVFLIYALQSTAQKPGYMGRRLLVKAKVVNGMQMPLNAVSLEYVIKRRFSLEAGVELFNYTRGPKGATRNTGRVKPVDGDDEYKEFRTLKNGTTTGWSVGISARNYFNAITPAPYGWFMSYSAGFGQLSFSGFDVSYDYRKTLTSMGFDPMIIPPDIKNISGEASVIRLEAPGIGYQRIYFRRLAVEAKAYLLVQYAMLPDHMLNAFEYNYFVKSNTVSYPFGNFSMGPGIDVKIGLLLF